jgi:ribosome biogenesis GTPase
MPWPRPGADLASLRCSSSTKTTPPPHPRPGVREVLLLAPARRPSASGHRVVCHPRGKKNLVVVGDRVLWQATHDEGTIESIEPRRNLFYRQDEVRTKSFAANLDQVIILLAARPVFSEMQLARALVAAEAQNIQPIIVLNKRDLAEPFELAWNRLAPYREIGYAVIPMSVLSTDDAGMAELAPRIDRKVTLVLGPSGVGKSTLINRLVPAAGALTAEISHALNSGKHTTTSTTWYWIDSGGARHSSTPPAFRNSGCSISIRRRSRV